MIDPRSIQSRKVPGRHHLEISCRMRLASRQSGIASASRPHTPELALRLPQQQQTLIRRLIAASKIIVSCTALGKVEVASALGATPKNALLETDTEASGSFAIIHGEKTTELLGCREGSASALRKERAKAGTQAAAEAVPPFGSV